MSAQAPSKPWYQSKLVWLGVVQTALGVLGLVAPLAFGLAAATPCDMSRQWLVASEHTAKAAEVDGFRHDHGVVQSICGT